jgi:hypothetical protein
MLTMPTIFHWTGHGRCSLPMRPGEDVRAVLNGRHESGFSRKIGHDRISELLRELETGCAEEPHSDRNIETCRTKRSGYWYCEPWLASG